MFLLTDSLPLNHGFHPVAYRTTSEPPYALADIIRFSWVESPTAQITPQGTQCCFYFRSLPGENQTHPILPSVVRRRTPQFMIIIPYQCVSMCIKGHFSLLSSFFRSGFCPASQFGHTCLPSGIIAPQIMHLFSMSITPWLLLCFIRQAIIQVLFNHIRCVQFIRYNVCDIRIDIKDSLLCVKCECHHRHIMRYRPCNAPGNYCCI